MTSGFPHRMRFKQFFSRYMMIVPFRSLHRCEDKIVDNCKLILDCAMGNPFVVDTVILCFAQGKRHIFLSEGMRQHLENLRNYIRNKSASIIQSVWRGSQFRRLNTMKKIAKKSMSLNSCNTRLASSLNPGMLKKSLIN